MTKQSRARVVEECGKRSQTTDWVTSLLEINSRGVRCECVEWSGGRVWRGSLLLVMGERALHLQMVYMGLSSMWYLT